MHVDAHERRRHQAEQREGRVAPSDRRVVQKRAPEAVLGGELEERTPRIGDGGEVAAGVVAEALARRARHYKLDARLLRAVAWQESGYQPHVVSSAGAFGVMQVTPDTWVFVEEVLLGYRLRRTAGANIRVGVAFLAHLLRRFGGDVRLALGAYHQGPASVRQHGLWRVTRRFVANVLALRGRV